MTLAIMQPYFFPYLGYYQGIVAVDKYILYDQLAYIKNGWIHRNRYLVVHRQPTYFVALVNRKSSFEKIADIELRDHRAWRKKILHAIFYNYRSSPFFDESFPIIEQVVNADVDRLTDLCAQSIQRICTHLDIATEVSRDTSAFGEMEEKLACAESDLPAIFPSIRLDPPVRKVIRAIEMCRIAGADTYVNAIGGQALYGKDVFRQNGIALQFVQTRPYRYPQSTSIFHPHLSILDVLMNCGREGTRRLLHEYDLI